MCVCVCVCVRVRVRVCVCVWGGGGEGGRVIKKKYGFYITFFNLKNGRKHMLRPLCIVEPCSVDAHQRQASFKVLIKRAITHSTAYI